MRFPLVAIVLCAAFATTALQAQDTETPVPERRMIAEEGIDYYGGDVRSIFDTTLELCVNACLSEESCGGITYNRRAAACFLKSEVTDRVPYEGAVSMRVLRAEAAVLERARERAAALPLRAERLAAARDLALTVGQGYREGQAEANQLIVDAQRYAGDRPEYALRLALAAVALSDDAGHWSYAAELALRDIPNLSYGTRQERNNIAANAAINGYLRAANTAGAANALNTLAAALEKLNQGRDMIKILRLSMQLAPAPATQTALDRAVGLYGFRVLDTRIESDLASPRICLEFSEPLRGRGFDYTPYVQLPEGDLAVEANDRSLCISGASHGSTLDLTLRQGLPALSGEALIRSVPQTFYIRDRAPVARFPGRAYVLASGPDATLPVVTVNTDRLDITIQRVVDRNVATLVRNGLMDRQMQRYEVGRLSSELGEPVWQGTAETGMELNRDVTTALPIGDAIAAVEPGVYALTASVPDTRSAPATQWFVITDLALASMSGPDGVHAFVRGLGDAKPRAEITVDLVARNNDILGSTETDAQGYARFPASLARGTAGSAPAVLIARTDDDYAFLSLSGAGFDLSDRGVEGRRAPGPIDIFAKTERGAYRPGETVFATILARDPSSEAVADVPLTVIVTRPDGVEYRRDTLADAGAGGRVWTMAVPPAAQRGNWTARIHLDPDKPQLASTTFQVEDFVPERIDFTMDLPEGPLRPGDTALVRISGRYLYGAPGADLFIEGETVLRATDTLDGYPGYRFGPHDVSRAPRFSGAPGGLTTDAEGNATVPMTLAEPEDLRSPFELTAVLRLSDASRRPVERRATRPLTPSGPMIGIRPLFEDLGEGSEARFEVIAVGADGERRALDAVRWTLSRVQRDYQWYQIDGRWNWEPIITRERVAEGEIALAADALANIAAPVDWGQYELTLSSEAVGFAMSSVAFSAGWYGADAGTDTPDRLEVALDKPAYAPGDTAKLRLNADDAGEVLVTVLGQGLIDMEMVSVAAGETEIDLPVTDAWRPGAYVTATLIRPADAATGHGPKRALGLNWANVDPGPAALAATLDVPEIAAPRQPLEVALAVDGIAEGETAYATIAAVDIGILNLTGYTAPDPQAHYLGQRRLAMTFRDFYGRLIDATAGNPGALRQGGDGGGGGLKGPPPTEDLVAFFAGPLTVGADGRVTTSFEMPDFNGSVRVMAIVWSESGVGSASTDVTVRDPVVMTANMPRFLAPGDHSALILDLAHVSGAAGEMQVAVQSDELLAVDLTETVTLPEGGRQRVRVPLDPAFIGDANLTATLTLPDGQALTKSLTLGILRNDPILARQSRVTLASGDSLALDPTIFAGLSIDGADAIVSAGPLARFDVPGLLMALDTYPYGCTEQVTSRALPLLYFSEVAEALDLATTEGLAARIADSIDAVLANQTRNGSFGLWSASGDGGLWLDAYVTDFLSRARATGHTVPDRAFESALNHLSNRVNSAPDFERGGQGLAYALYTLAREGRAAMGDLRYYADARGDAFATPLAKAQIGAALAAYGDPVRADAMFRKAAANIGAGDPDERLWRADYGSGLRDRAAVLSLATEAGSEVFSSGDLGRRVAIEASLNTTASTQEQLWSLMAARALLSDTTSSGLTRNGQPVEGPLVNRLGGRELIAAPVEIGNAGTGEIEAVLTVFGVPTEPEPAQGNGYQIRRDYYDLDGNAVDPADVAVGTRMVTVLTIRPERDQRARLMINDPLPAGFEIENPALLQGGDVQALDWLDLGPIATHSEFMTDRFRAAVDWQGTDSFRLGYLVRATMPGDFAHPAASVEDMYRPAYRARTDAGRVFVTEE